MDFLPFPEHPHELSLVPDLGGPEYDGGSFQDYGARVGWNVEKLRQGDLQSLVDSSSNELPVARPEARAMQFVQTWLFFGTLSEVLGQKVARSEYSTGSCITTKTLVVDTNEMYKRIYALPAERRMSHHIRIRDCLNHGSLFLQEFASSTKDKSSALLSEEVYSSLTSLIFYLNFRFSHFGQHRSCSADFVHYMHNDLLKDRLVDNGWCPNLTQRLRLQMGPPGLYYGSLLGLAKDNLSHVDCSEQHCFALTIDENTYQTRHVQAGCNCIYLGPPSAMDSATLTATIQSLLKQGTVPLIDMSQDLHSTSDMPIPVVARTENSSYIAISHVWADGLGNPFNNTLPCCQLQVLKERVRAATAQCSLNPSGLVWMDTLCVPLEPPSRRNAAVEAMRTTYQSAQAVLVLDATLVSINAPVRNEEALVRIFCSNWMTRLWTLQEAALSSRLLFQFADRVLDFAELLDVRVDDVDYHPADFLSHEASTQLRRVIRNTESTEHVKPWVQLAKMWRSLEWRSTSHERDIPICVATLIGLDVRELHERSGGLDERDLMQAFWSCLKEVPQNILWTRGPNLTRSSFRWAPGSLLECSRFSAIPAPWTQSAECTPNGLLVQGLPGYWIHNVWVPQADDGTFDFVEPTTGQTFHVSQIARSATPSWTALKIHLQSKLVLLLRDRLAKDLTVDGVLLNQYANVDSVVRTQWLARVRVFGRDSAYYKALRTRPSSQKRMYSKQGLLAARDPKTGILQDAWVEEVVSPQRWCIS